MKLIRMNERILELNAQADKYAWEKVGEKYDEFGSLNRSLNWLLSYCHDYCLVKPC